MSHLGAKVIAAASNNEKLALAKKYGASDGINYSDIGLKEALKELTEGNGVDVIFDPSGSRPEICVEAGVARKRIAPPRLQASVLSGIGLEILPPRAEYERWLARPTCPPLGDSVEVTGPIPTHHEQSMKSYRFRMIRRAGASPQFLTIHCETEAGARARALTRAGPGWRIADVQPL